MRLASAMGRETRLLYCTMGILLRRLTGDGNLRGVSHVVVDEVHEATCPDPSNTENDKMKNGKEVSEQTQAPGETSAR